MSNTYYILSLKHSPGQGGVAVWWGDNNCGYFTNLESAGIYTQEQIDSNPMYYNDGENTIAVDEVLAVQLSVRVVSYPAIIKATCPACQESTEQGDDMGHRCHRLL